MKSIPKQLKKSLFEEKAISLEEFLTKQSAKCHKSCYLKFNTTELRRKEKRSLDSVTKLMKTLKE